MIDKMRKSISALKTVWVTPRKGQSFTRGDIGELKRMIAGYYKRAGHYDAAYTNRLRDDWPFTSDVPYGDIKPDLYRIIARSRREIDNNGIAAGINRTLLNNIWGEGPVIQSQVKFKNGQMNKRVNDELDQMWEIASEHIDCTGMANFGIWGREALETIVASGTVIINRVNSDDIYLNFSFSMHEPDILDTSYDIQTINQDMNKPSRQVLHGIALDERYRPVWYHIKGIQTPIPVEFMRHFYVRNRPGQVIGVPWMKASLSDLWDYDQLKEDTLTKSRILADIALWLDPDGGLWPGQANENNESEVNWEPGQFLRTKKKPEVIQATGDLNQTLNPLLKRVLLDACSGSGTSYMAASRDMDGVNYAASRTNLNEDRAGYKFERLRLVQQFCKYVRHQFVKQCVVEGRVSITPEQFISDPHRYTRASYQFPTWDWVDPKADSAAVIGMYESGLFNLKDSLARRGADWREHIDQTAEEILYITEVAKSKKVSPEELIKYLRIIKDGKNAEENDNDTE